MRRPCLPQLEAAIVRQYARANEALVISPLPLSRLVLRGHVREPPLGMLGDRHAVGDRVVTEIETAEGLAQLLLGGLLRFVP
jgi:hypothetical protein